MAVNDLGGSMEGVGADAGPASAVAAEIVAAGGSAVADTHDVGTTDGRAGAGRRRRSSSSVAIDVLINNAGIIAWAGFPEADEDNLARHLAVHVAGSFATARAAWPHMVEQGYGRIVMTTSSGMFGLPDNTSYATAKARRDRAHPQPRHGRGPARHQGEPHRPRGHDPHGGPGRGRRARQMSPDLVAPMAAFLAHEDCPVSGEIYAAGAGRFARIFIASTEGYVHPTPRRRSRTSPRNWATINDETDYYVPADLMSWSAAFLAHLR